MNRDADHPRSPGSEVGGEAAQIDDSDTEIEVPVDGLLDWGRDPAMPDGSPEAELEQVAIAQLVAERDEYLDSLRRLQADFDNFRKRSLRQQTELLERASEGLCLKLLPVLDALDLATEHLRDEADTNEGYKALAQIDALLRDVLAREGLERIDAVGVSFDPTVHDAVGHVPIVQKTTDDAEAVEPGEETAGRAQKQNQKGAKAVKPQGDGPQVAQVMRAGYRLKSKVLRPAMVLVGD